MIINTLDKQLNNFRDSKFVIIKSNVKIDIINNLFDGLVSDFYIYQFDSYYIILYKSKEFIEFNYIYLSMVEDFGENISLFDGFRVKDIESLNRFLDIFFKYDNIFYGYMKVTDFILKSNFDSIDIYKDILLYKYDDSFIKIIYSLFNNDLNVSKTSNASFIHRNTLNNKIKEFYEDTNILLTKFNDALCLYMILK